MISKSVLFVLHSFFIGVGAVAFAQSAKIGTDLTAEDCLLFRDIQSATAGRITYSQGTPNKTDRCQLKLNDSAVLATDKKIHGFGGHMILIISDRPSYNRLSKYVGAKGVLESKQKVGNISLNEKIFSTPVFSVQCEAQEKTCQIQLAGP